MKHGHSKTPKAKTVSSICNVNALRGRRREKKKKPLKFNLLSISELGEPLHLDITNAATLQGSALSHTCLCQAHQYPTLEDLSISDDDAGIVASFSVSKHYSMALWGGWGWESSLMAIGKRKS